jgi:hypothetical protein
MTIEPDSVHFLILERLCSLPKPVRGTSAAMLDRHYNDPRAIDELKAQGLIRERGWHDGPGAILIPTAAGEALYEELANQQVAPVAPRWVNQASSGSGSSRAGSGSGRAKPGSPDQETLKRSGD